VKCIHCEKKRLGIVEDEYEPEWCTDWRRIRASIRQMERFSPSFWAKQCERRASTRVALAGFRRAAKERQNGGDQ
jgi:hypothetical protein